MTSEANDRSFLYLFLEPVREYLADDAVSEILINGPERVYIERSGKLEEVSTRFVSESALRAAAANIAKSVGRILDEAHPRLDARLPDGSRVHAVVPPLSRVGTVIAIRKFRKDALVYNLITDAWSEISGGEALARAGGMLVPALEEGKAKANAARSALDDARNIGHHEGIFVAVGNHAKVGFQCCERIIGDFGFCSRNDTKKRRFASVGESHKAYIGKHF